MSNLPLETPINNMVTGTAFEDPAGSELGTNSGPVPPETGNFDVLRQGASPSRPSGSGNRYGEDEHTTFLR